MIRGTRELLSTLRIVYTYSRIKIKRILIVDDDIEKENFVTKNVAAFLLDKPIWEWWIFYFVVTGALFGIFSLAIYLLGIQWWIGVFILLATGIIWGSVKYSQIKGKIKAEKSEAEQPVKSVFGCL